MTSRFSEVDPGLTLDHKLTTYVPPARMSAAERRRLIARGAFYFTAVALSIAALWIDARVIMVVLVDHRSLFLPTIGVHLIIAALLAIVPSPFERRRRR